MYIIGKRIEIFEYGKLDNDSNSGEIESRPIPLAVKQKILKGLHHGWCVVCCIHIA